MMPFAIPGLLIAGGALALATTRGARIVLYGASGDGSAEFRRVAYGPASALLATNHIYPIFETEEIRGAIEHHSRIKTFVWVGHGTSNSIRADEARVRGEMGVQGLARLLAPRLAIGGRIGLAACSAGVDGGFASQLRDAIVARAPWLVLGGEVRAHSTVGHTTANPNGRAFPFRQRGRAQGIVVRATEPWILGV
jgi:hypothetical protein